MLYRDHTGSEKVRMLFYYGSEVNGKDAGLTNLSTCGQRVLAPRLFSGTTPCGGMNIQNHVAYSTTGRRTEELQYQ